ncbi:GSCFA domain-containing protein [Bizionia saleffrena]|uniref:GSCFA domain-containing protein n=1 Tax=Bizionia saleffrena TaxID=291189 RepID=A0A8H2LKW8_9FLAO|nr:GSCFA domain-containing protein [Bizionia saleffrena]TYB72533.1 GSCFA domain-containing protein [Bizionia saleffrena]
MKLQTQIPIQKADNPIDYESNVVLFGSCFAENISEKFSYFKFQNTSNPFGILFHPKAIENLIVNALQQKVYTKDDVFYYNERWQCYDAHSKLSCTSEEGVLATLNAKLELTNYQLKKASHIIITLGTAWVYALKESSVIVANCHKVPQKEFEKCLLTIAEITKSLETIISKVKAINPKVQFVFTVSPVRHIKDGFIENTLSKSHLIAAIHHLLKTESNSDKRVSYFPSFEIMIDELRDYRFYNEDLLHPNMMAVHYIWEQFQSAWIVPKATPIMKEIDAVQKGLIHKPFNPSSQAHLKFLEDLQRKIAHLQSLNINF